MHILIGVVLALALLYGWLVGNWFARALVFLAFGSGLALFGLSTRPGSALGEVLVVVLGFAAAWFLAAIPTYFWRHQNRRFLAHL